MPRILWTTGTLLAMLGVALGAFGAHGLADLLAANARETTFQTASQYHLYHALAILAAAWLYDKTGRRLARWAAGLFAAGIILFSGSLYLLAVTDVGTWGAVAPVGGAAFLLGWGCLAAAGWRGPVAGRK